MATLNTRQKNGVDYWYIDWRNQDGQRRRKSLGKVKDVPKKRANAIKAQIEAGLLGDDSPKAKRDTLHFISFLERYLIEYKITKAATTYDRVTSIYKAHLTPFFGDYILTEITPDKVSEYIDKRYNDFILKNGLFTESNKETINKELRQLKALLNKAVEWHAIRYNPIANVKQLNVQELEKATFTESELTAIYETATYPHWAQLLANTGMRLGELVNLKWSDIDADKINIKNSGLRRRTINKIDLDKAASGRTKSGKNRIIPISNGVRKALDTFAELRKQGDIYLMPRMAPKSYIRALKRDIARAGLEGSGHNYRHTFCSQLAEKGMDSKTIQLLAGHSKLSVTEVYLHADIDNVLNKVNLDL